MKKFFVLIVALLFVGRAAGWGKEGHIIVAEIAECGLTDKTKAEIAKLGFDHIGTDEVANYADEVRRNKDYPQYFKSGPWHFIDLPIDDDYGYKDVQKFVEKNPPNVVTKIADFVAVLKDPKASKEDKGEALKFVVHFVGDVHQPMHCAERNDDHGGNGLKVHYLDKGGKYLNLHHFWDTNLVLLATNKEPLDKVADKWFNEVDDKFVKDATANMDSAAWAYESYKIATQHAYTQDGKPLPLSGPVDLNEQYADDGKEIVEQQIKKAGVRLAKVLNEIFDNDSNK